MTRITITIAFLAALASNSAAAQSPEPAPVGTPVWGEGPRTEADPTPEPMPTPQPYPDGTEVDIEPAAPAAGAPPKPGDAPRISGFVTVRYLSDDGKGLEYAGEHGSDVQHARLNVAGAVHPLVSDLIAIDAADIKANSGSALREAYITYKPKIGSGKIKPKVNAGRLRRPAGVESMQDDNQLLTTDRSLFSGFVQHDDRESPDQDFRDIGIRVGAEVGPVDVLGMAMTNGSTTINPTGSPDEDDAKDAYGRVGFNLGVAGARVRAGVSGAGGQDAHSHVYGAAGDVPLQFWTSQADVLVEAMGLLFLAEAAYGKRTVGVVTPTGGFRGTDTATGTAGYVLVGYRIKDKTTPFFRFAYREPTLGGSDEDAKRIRDWSNEATIGVNVQLVKKKLTARAQYSARSGFVPPHPATVGAAGYTKDLHGTFQGSLQVDF